jgi:hypothetical protein
MHRQRLNTLLLLVAAVVVFVAVAAAAQGDSVLLQDSRWVPEQPTQSPLAVAVLVLVIPQTKEATDQTLFFPP